jgi:glutamine amidotransferase
MSVIAIVDYGMGNLHSAAKALEKVAPDAKVIVTRSQQDIKKADRVMFPGVGAIRDCMHEIKKQDLVESIVHASQTKPFLAICVGMQALMEFSEENQGTECLGIFKGQVKFFGADLADKQTQERLKIPHMGWNQVHQTRPHPLWSDIAQDARFYFVHSYYVEPADSSDAAGETTYGHGFASALARDNIFATQFHPEKSAHAGLQLLANFAQWDGQS